MSEGKVKGHTPTPFHIYMTKEAFMGHHECACKFSAQLYDKRGWCDCDNKVITTMVIRLLDNCTRCAQSVVADLQPLGLGYVGVGDGRIR